LEIRGGFCDNGLSGVVRVSLMNASRSRTTHGGPSAPRGPYQGTPSTSHWGSPPRAALGLRARKVAAWRRCKFWAVLCCCGRLLFWLQRALRFYWRARARFHSGRAVLVMADSRRISIRALCSPLGRCPRVPRRAASDESALARSSGCGQLLYLDNSVALPS
jgi:hypothetical protein